VVSRGFDDELEVHRRLNPGAMVIGAPERARAVEAAAARGARAAVLDDGFQHRRLARDLEWTVVRVEDAGRWGWERLPAGPARDRWSELARSDAVILTYRDQSAGDGLPRLMERLRLQFPAAAVAACRIRHAGLEAVNAAAAARSEAAPRVAFASVMHGEEFLDRQVAARPGLEGTYLFPDHHHMEEETIAEMARAAKDGGLMGTLKDVVKVAGRLDPAIPLWYVSEEVVWGAGSGRLSAQLDHLAWLGGGQRGSAGGGREGERRFGAPPDGLEDG
jgi:tetraacyldisaccharide 4'-kinase